MLLDFYFRFSLIIFFAVMRSTWSAFELVISYLVQIILICVIAYINWRSRFFYVFLKKAHFALCHFLWFAVKLKLKMKTVRMEKFASICDADRSWTDQRVGAQQLGFSGIASAARLVGSSASMRLLYNRLSRRAGEQRRHYFRSTHRHCTSYWWFITAALSDASVRFLISGQLSASQIEPR